MKFVWIMVSGFTIALLVGVLPMTASAVTVNAKPTIAKSVSHNIALAKTTPRKKVAAKKKSVPKHKKVVIHKKHKPFLMTNAPLLDPNNPPSSPNSAGG